MEHVGYPHEPGTLYECQACEDNHYYDGDVHCAVLSELADDGYIAENDPDYWDW